mmetsp:Transcript_96610/g.288437  ORF Transcript_96610/g.288437 Transcript_96610/m.288437 type:complete len:223 (+) Transcript_96610:346-1014(+)
MAPSNKAVPQMQYQHMSPLPPNKTSAESSHIGWSEAWPVMTVHATLAALATSRPPTAEPTSARKGRVYVEGPRMLSAPRTPTASARALWCGKESTLGLRRSAFSCLSDASRLVERLWVSANSALNNSSSCSERCNRCERFQTSVACAATSAFAASAAASAASRRALSSSRRCPSVSSSSLALSPLVTLPAPAVALPLSAAAVALLVPASAASPECAASACWE